MPVPLAFFSFTQLLDASDHLAYNAWHQFDHVPENRALGGVQFGERWVRTPECVAAGRADPDFAGVQYLTLYLLGEPIEQSRAAWRDLATATTHLGRRPDLSWRIARPLVGGFVPVKGYVAPRTSVSADALPHRPLAGVHVTMSRLTGPKPAVEAVARRRDRETIPTLLGRNEVAGAWTFVGEGAFPSRGPSGAAEDPVCITVFFLDSDPLKFAGAAQDVAEAARADQRRVHGDVEQVLVEGPMLSISAGSWSWFAEPAPGS